MFSWQQFLSPGPKDLVVGGFLRVWDWGLKFGIPWGFEDSVTWVGEVLGIRNLGSSRDCRAWRDGELGIYIIYILSGI